MVGNAKMVIEAVIIPPTKVLPTSAGQAQLGHDFLLEAKLKVEKKTLIGKDSVIEAPELEWKELIDWFDLQGKNWHYVGQSSSQGYEDLYAKNPNSNTFRPWKVRYSNALNTDNNPPQALKDAVKNQQDYEGAAKQWIAKNGHKWTLSFVDTPKLGTAPGGTSAGGAGASLVTSNTRRRVIYFDIGFKGSRVRATATQVLEMVNGKPTIQRFFLPAISKEVANKPENLEKWRTQYANKAPETFKP